MRDTSAEFEQSSQATPKREYEHPCLESDWVAECPNCKGNPPQYTMFAEGWQCDYCGHLTDLDEAEEHVTPYRGETNGDDID